jgi:hypothetical protein
LLRRGIAWAVWGSAVLFAALHFRAVLREPSALAAAWEVAWPFGIGLLLAALVVRTGSIWIGVLAHALLNLFSDTSPEPKSWTGWALAGEPIDWGFPLAALVVWALALSTRRRWAYVLGAVLGVAIVALLGLGLAKGGPRPGWEGPGLDGRLSMLWGEPDETGVRDVRYRFAFVPAGEVTRIELAFPHAPEEVRDLWAHAGTVRWRGRAQEGRLVWEGAMAPATDYTFRSVLPPPRRTGVRIEYVDYYGWARVWEGEITPPE